MNPSGKDFTPYKPYQRLVSIPLKCNGCADVLIFKYCAIIVKVTRNVEV